MSIFDDQEIREKAIDDYVSRERIYKEITEKLSNDIAKEIDKEILKTLYELGHDNYKI